MLRNPEAGPFRVAVIATLSPDVAGEIDALKRRYDAIAAHALPPHVTVYGTLEVTDPGDLGALTEKTNRLLEDRPIRLAIGPLSRFDGAKPVVWYSLEGEVDRLHAINRKFRDELGMDSDLPYVPHITLTEHLNPDASADVYETLRNGSPLSGGFTLSRLGIWLRTDRFTWIELTRPFS